MTFNLKTSSFCMNCIVVWKFAKMTVAENFSFNHIRCHSIRGHSMTTWTRRGGSWSKKSLFLSTFKVKNVHVEVGGGQKRTKLCPRSHWMPPNWCGSGDLIQIYFVWEYFSNDYCLQYPWLDLFPRIVSAAAVLNNKNGIEGWVFRESRKNGKLFCGLFRIFELY